jgi:hypothetical protein
LFKINIVQDQHGGPVSARSGRFTAVAGTRALSSSRAWLDAALNEAMLYPRSDLTTLRACQAGIGHIGEHRGNAELGRLAGGEVLPLPPPGGYSQRRLDGLANGARIDAQRLSSEGFL